ncbi:MAG: hypothetical protein WCY63_11745 [Weeksellaceae bacterium]
MDIVPGVANRCGSSCSMVAISTAKGIGDHDSMIQKSIIAHSDTL